MSFHVTFETCRPDLSMSVHRGRSEVTGEQSEQRDWRFRISSSGANDRFARPSFADYSEFIGHDRIMSVLRRPLLDHEPNAVLHRERPAKVQEIQSAIGARSKFFREVIGYDRKA